MARDGRNRRTVRLRKKEGLGYGMKLGEPHFALFFGLCSPALGNTATSIQLDTANCVMQSQPSTPT